MFHELQTWWQNWWPTVTPETRALLQHGGVALAALLGGHLLGSLVTRFLRGRDFDAALRLSASPPAGEEHRGVTPTFVAGMLVRLTVWGAVGAWIARQHG